MKKVKFLAICSLIIVSILVGIYATPFSSSLHCSSDTWKDDFESGLFLYDSSRHEMINPVWMVSRIPPTKTLEEIHSYEHSGTAIIIGEVAGPSLNRIIWPRQELRSRSITGGFNHVVTPVLVHYIVFVGDEIGRLAHIQVGEVVDIIEGYFYVTDETQEYANGIPIGTLITHAETRPMESGNRYVIYLHYGDNRPVSIYHIDSEFISVAMQRDLIHRLGALSPIEPLSSIPTHGTPGWHEAANAMYGHLHQSLPLAPPAPIIAPRTSNELTITVQGTPIATAIYDGNGNRLIQQGLGLYRETNARTLERVGERVSLSHALRRYRYILEPGEWIFRDLDFSTTALPASFQVLAFEGYEQVAMAYYADSPSSSNMELHVMPNGRTMLTDREANVIISPTKIFP